MTSFPHRTAQLLPGSSFIAQAARYLAVGSSGMVLYLGAYAAFTMVLSAVASNVVAWVISTVVSNAAHRRVTFGVSGPESARADAAIGMMTSLLGLVLSSVAVTLAASASGPVQLLALLGGSSIAGSTRFLVMRWWLGRTHSAPAAPQAVGIRSMG